MRDEQGGEHHRRADGDDIGFEQVGGHAGAVADIVADVVGDDGRVAGVVLGNSGLDLADQVGADVGGLGEDAAAETGEDRDQRGTEGERDERVDHGAIIGRVIGDLDEVIEEARDREQGQAGDEHAGHGTGAERHRQALLEPDAGRLRGADVGANRDVHADEAGRAGQQRAEHEARRRQAAEEEEDDRGDDDADDGDRHVLAAQIGRGAFLDRRGDLHHAGVAGRGAKHLLAGENAVEQRHEAAADRDKYQIHGDECPPLTVERPRRALDEGGRCNGDIARWQPPLRTGLF